VLGGVGRVEPVRGGWGGPRRPQQSPVPSERGGGEALVDRSSLPSPPREGAGRPSSTTAFAPTPPPPRSPSPGPSPTHTTCKGGMEGLSRALRGGGGGFVESFADAYRVAPRSPPPPALLLLQFHLMHADDDVRSGAGAGEGRMSIHLVLRPVGSRAPERPSSPPHHTYYWTHIYRKSLETYKRTFV
jgi:hypothetical protein